MKNITIAGTILVDIIKFVDTYPQKGMLANITEIKNAVGGCVPNTSITLARLGGIQVAVSGRIGADAYGKFISSHLKKEEIDISNLIVTENIPTGFTDVMTELSSGERTFFNLRGANALFKPEDVNLNDDKTSIFHIGYISLMDIMDSSNPEYGTNLAKLLCETQKKGIKTSIDVVSNGSGIKEMVLPVLKYCNYVIINELEGGMISGIEPRVNGKLNIDNIKKITQFLCEHGVERTVIHCPEMGFIMNNGKFTSVSSLSLPKGYIKGSVGAGDAFCAGILYSFYKGFDDKAALETASCVAAANLAVADSVSGAVSFEKTMDLAKNFIRK